MWAKIIFGAQISTHEPATNHQRQLASLHKIVFEIFQRGSNDQQSQQGTKVNLDIWRCVGFCSKTKQRKRYDDLFFTWKGRFQSSINNYDNLGYIRLFLSKTNSSITLQSTVKLTVNKCKRSTFLDIQYLLDFVIRPKQDKENVFEITRQKYLEIFLRLKNLSLVRPATFLLL